MKKIITENFSLKILSLIIAFIFWLLIINVTNPVKTKIIKDIPVTVINEDVLSNLGQCYEITSQDTVNVSVRGKKSVVDKLKSTDFEAIADLEKISITSSVPVEVSLTKNVDDEPDIISGKNSTILLKLDNEITNSYSVTLNLVGTPTTDYYISKDEVALSVKKIKASGPEQIIETIDHIQVDVDISDIIETYKTKYELVAYDSNGKKITSKRVELSKDFIDVTVSPLQIKSVSVKANASGDVDSNHIYKSIETSIKSIKVAGTAENLSTIDNIMLDVDITDAISNAVKEYNVYDYIPENVKLVSDTDKINVKINVDELSNKKIQFTAASVKFVNLPNDIMINYDNNTALSVMVKGEEADLDDITIDDLAPHIDASGLGLGTQNVQIVFDEIDGITVINPPLIVVQLTDKASITQENEGQTTTGDGITDVTQ